VTVANHELYDDFHRFYDRINAGRDEEHGYYRRVIASGDSVLEIACGSGTLTQTFADIGASVVGVDLSQPMLDIARARLPKLDFVCCDMRDFSVGRRFDKVVCGFNSFMHMLSDGDALDALQTIRDHCKPGGEAIIDIFAIAAEFIAPQTSGTLVLDTVDHLTGRQVMAYEDSVFDATSGILTVTLRLVDSATQGELVRSTTAMRFFDQARMLDLLGRAGLTVIRIAPNYADDPARPRVRQIIHARPVTARMRRKGRSETKLPTNTSTSKEDAT
jgi:SAM-dependent methyltransferase